MDQLFDCVNLVIVQQGHGRAFEGHEGNQPFKPAAVEQPQNLGTGIQIGLVHFGAAFPIPAVNIRELDYVLPIVGIVKHLAFAHGTAGHVDKLPVQAEHILAAELFSGGGHSLKAEAPGDMVRNHRGAEEACFRAVENPERILVDEGTFAQLKRVNGVVEYGDCTAAKGGNLCYDFHFLFVKGDFHKHQLLYLFFPGLWPGNDVSF